MKNMTTTTCNHPADKINSDTLLLACPDCGAECSQTQIGDDRLCYDERCPLHALAGELRSAAAMLGRKGGQAGKGEAKRRRTTFTVGGPNPRRRTVILTDEQYAEWDGTPEHLAAITDRADLAHAILSDEALHVPGGRQIQIVGSH